MSGLIAQEGQPALVAACAGRLLADEPLRARLAAAASSDGAGEVAERVEALYFKTPRPRRLPPEPDLAPPILCDFHMHTDHSPDCETAVPDLVNRALELGLGAIAVTDHNTIAGGIAAQAYVAEHGLPLHVVVGSEVMTATGEVIGLYLTEEIPRGMPFADTVEAIRAQGAIVYVPHPFDRLHRFRTPRCCAAWPTRSTCWRPATAGSTARRTTARPSASPSATTCWPARDPTHTCSRASP